MRQLAEFAEESRARALGDVLAAAGIDNRVERARAGGVTVWVHDEKRLAAARAIAADFAADPDASRFAAASTEAARQRRARAAEARAASRRLIRPQEGWRRAAGIGAVTLGLILASVATALWTTSPAGIARLVLGDKTDAVSLLSFQSYVAEGGYYRWRSGMSDLAGGELWRLFTPMFLHFGLFHLVFNLWWLRDLGTAIERRQSSVLLAVQVLAIAGVSNAAQYLIGGSPAFGGMSGVVYGLFAYVWVRGRLDPASGYAPSPTTAYWMLGFYVLCWTGLIGPVANVAHTGGLVLGAAWGWFAAGRHRRSLGGSGRG